MLPLSSWVGSWPFLGLAFPSRAEVHARGLVHPSRGRGCACLLGVGVGLPCWTVGRAFLLGLQVAGFLLALGVAPAFLKLEMCFLFSGWERAYFGVGVGSLLGLDRLRESTPVLRTSLLGLLWAFLVGHARFLVFFFGTKNGKQHRPTQTQKVSL